MNFGKYNTIISILILKMHICNSYFLIKIHKYLDNLVRIKNVFAGKVFSSFWYTIRFLKKSIL